MAFPRHKSQYAYLSPFLSNQHVSLKGQKFKDRHSCCKVSLFLNHVCFFIIYYCCCYCKLANFNLSSCRSLKTYKCTTCRTFFKTFNELVECEAKHRLAAKKFGNTEKVGNNGKSGNTEKVGNNGKGGGGGGQRSN